MGDTPSLAARLRVEKLSYPLSLRSSIAALIISFLSAKRRSLLIYFPYFEGSFLRSQYTKDYLLCKNLLLAK